jgi:hypothetical protein
MYIFAYFVTWVFLIIPLVVDIKSRETFNILQVFRSFFFPMKGVWNLIIFVYDKSYLVYRGDDYEGCWKTIKIVLFRPSHSTGIILPDSFHSNDENRDVVEMSNAHNFNLEENAIDDNNHGRVVLHDGTTLSQDGAPSIVSSSSSSFEKAIECKGVDYLGNKNRRYYLDKRGIRRTGELEDIRKGRIAYNSSNSSIASPVGYFSGSGNDTLSGFDEVGNVSEDVL